MSQLFKIGHPCRSFPEIFRPALSLLPRRALDWMEIHARAESGRSVPRSPLRVALVKSEYCAHIYSRPGSGRDLRGLALSTVKTFGPLSLFSRFEADFLVVRCPSDPECQLWREFFADEPDPEKARAVYGNFPGMKPQGAPEGYPSQGQSAVAVESVDWSRYDAVIAQDLCVPERILRNHPAIFWSYWLSETGTPSFRNSYQRPLAGYQAFLNGGSRRWRVRPTLKSHALEFPYILQDSASHRSLGARPWDRRSGILLEVHTAMALPDEIRRQLGEICPVHENRGSPETRLRLLHESRYFLQMIPKRLWGNSLNEAVAAGCLGLANADSMPNNRSLLLPGLTPEHWADAMAILRALEANPVRAGQLQAQQQALADWLLCDRPLGEWLLRMGRGSP